MWGKQSPTQSLYSRNSGNHQDQFCHRQSDASFEFDASVILGFAAEDLYTVQKEVIELLKGRILVGHALHNDLKVRERVQEHLQINMMSGFDGYTK